MRGPKQSKEGHRPGGIVGLYHQPQNDKKKATLRAAKAPINRKTPASREEAKTKSFKQP